VVIKWAIKLWKRLLLSSFIHVWVEGWGERISYELVYQRVCVFFCG
jgi:hypothetical protein